MLLLFSSFELRFFSASWAWRAAIRVSFLFIVASFSAISACKAAKSSLSLTEVVVVIFSGAAARADGVIRIQFIEFFGSFCHIFVISGDHTQLLPCGGLEKFCPEVDLPFLSSSEARSV